MALCVKGAVSRSAHPLLRINKIDTLGQRFQLVCFKYKMAFVEVPAIAKLGGKRENSRRRKIFANEKERRKIIKTCAVGSPVICADRDTAPLITGCMNVIFA